MFLSPEQFSEMTGRSLDEIRAEADAVAAANHEARLRRGKALVLRPHLGADVPVEFVGLGLLDGDADDEDLARLGVSPRLVERLRSWQEGWEARVEIPADPGDFTPGRALSVRLARQLQAELPGHDVYLDIDGEGHSVRDLAP
jgi:hypothetical protein